MDDVSSILKGTKTIIESEINFRKFFIYLLVTYLVELFFYFLDYSKDKKSV